MPKRATWKIVLGTVLLIITPFSLFVKPITRDAIIRDLLLAIWWAFVFWLLASGFKTYRPKNSE
jgi:hypothetical protein